MIIIGKDSVGKTITLQLHTLIESNNYKKIYFHFSQKIKFSGIKNNLEYTKRYIF